MKKEEKYNFIITILGMILTITAVILLFPKISNSAISINVDKDLAFFLYYGSLFILYFGTFWSSTVKRLDYNLKVEFIEYKDTSFAILLASNMAPMLMLVFGTFDSFGGTLSVINWSITVSYIVLALVLRNNNYFKKFSKFIPLLLSLIFLIISIILIPKDPFRILAFCYIIGDILLAFSLLLKYNLIKSNNKNYIYPLVLLLSNIIIFLGNFLILYNAY